MNLLALKINILGLTASSLSESVKMASKVEITSLQEVHVTTSASKKKSRN